MKKQLEWTGKPGRAESLGISKADQTVLARLMESQIWQWLADSVALWWEGLEKGKKPMLVLMPDTSVPSFMPPVPFKLLALVLELRGSESEE